MVTAPDEMSTVDGDTVKAVTAGGVKSCAYILLLRMLKKDNTTKRQKTTRSFLFISIVKFKSIKPSTSNLERSAL